LRIYYKAANSGKFFHIGGHLTFIYPNLIVAAKGLHHTKFNLEFSGHSKSGMEGIIPSKLMEKLHLFGDTGAMSQSRGNRSSFRFYQQHKQGQVFLRNYDSEISIACDGNWLLRRVPAPSMSGVAVCREYFKMFRS